MSKDVYIRLREFMDTMPAGYPETESGVEIKLLKKMFSPEQAELTMQLTRHRETAAEIAKRTSMDEGELAGKLEELALDGLIFRNRDGEKVTYRAYQFIIGVYEFQLNRLDREFAELFEEYLPILASSRGEVRTEQLRILPVESSVTDKDRVASYDRVREMVEAEETIAVNPCICRKEQELLDNRCHYPMENCLMFGQFAEYYIDNKLGRRIDKKETFKILDEAEEQGLVLRTSNATTMDAICTCCPCCCGSLRLLKKAPNPGELVASTYRSSLDEDLCTGCGECMVVCPMDAIIEEDGIAQVIEKRCLGCGLCINRCPVEALSMVEVEGHVVEELADSFDDVLERIAGERGL